MIPLITALLNFLTALLNTMPPIINLLMNLLQIVRTVLATTSLLSGLPGLSVLGGSTSSLPALPLLGGLTSSLPLPSTGVSNVVDLNPIVNQAVTSISGLLLKVLDFVAYTVSELTSLINLIVNAAQSLIGQALCVVQYNLIVVGLLTGNVIPILYGCASNLRQSLINALLPVINVLQSSLSLDAVNINLFEIFCMDFIEFFDCHIFRC